MLANPTGNLYFNVGCPGAENKKLANSWVWNKFTLFKPAPVKYMVDKPSPVSVSLVLGCPKWQLLQSLLLSWKPALDSCQGPAQTVNRCPHTPPVLPSVVLLLQDVWLSPVSPLLYSQHCHQPKQSTTQISMQNIWVPNHNLYLKVASFHSWMWRYQCRKNCAL